MIVFPGRRRVGLKAATASSSDAIVADVRPQPSIAHALDDLIQLGAIGFDRKAPRNAYDASLTEPKLASPSRGRTSGRTR